MFLLYPNVTKVAFDGLSPCYELDDGSGVTRGFLIADVDIECRTPKHTRVRMLAWLAVALYPVGLMVINSLLLFKARGVSSTTATVVVIVVAAMRPTPLYAPLHSCIATLTRCASGGDCRDAAQVPSRRHHGRHRARHSHTACSRHDHLGGLLPDPNAGAAVQEQERRLPRVGLVLLDDDGLPLLNCL